MKKNQDIWRILPYKTETMIYRVSRNWIVQTKRKSGNQYDRLDHGTDVRGTKHGENKLSEADVLAICEALDSGVSTFKVAAQYGFRTDHGYGYQARAQLGVAPQTGWVPLP